MGMDVGASEGKKGRGHPEMNVTPLVDVVLVLLIIFMVVTPALHGYFWIHLPNEPEENQPTPPANGPPPVVVSVTAAGEIRINREIVPDGEFREKLHRVLAARQDRKIFFDAANDAPYARAVEVLDMAREGGAANIAVMTEALE